MTKTESVGIVCPLEREIDVCRVSYLVESAVILLVEAQKSMQELSAKDQEELQQLLNESLSDFITVEV